MWCCVGCLTNTTYNSFYISLPPLKAPWLTKPMIALFHFPVSLTALLSLCSWVPLQLSGFSWQTPSLQKKCLLLDLDCTYNFFLWMSPSFCCCNFWAHWILSGWPSVPFLCWQWLLSLLVTQIFFGFFFFEAVVLVKILNSVPLCWSLLTPSVLYRNINAYNVTCCHLLFNQLVQFTDHFLSLFSLTDVICHIASYQILKSRKIRCVSFFYLKK